MRVWMAGALLAWAPLTAVAESGVEDVISDQIKAFQAGDGAAAYDYASPTIQRLFGTPERFTQMVQRGYPMVWRPDDVRFLDQREVGGLLWQRVLIRDQAGVLHVLDYQMLRIDGAWRINGVQILGAPEAGA